MTHRYVSPRPMSELRRQHIHGSLVPANDDRFTLGPTIWAGLLGLLFALVVGMVVVPAIAAAVAASPGWSGKPRASELSRPFGDHPISQGETR